MRQYRKKAVLTVTAVLMAVSPALAQAPAGGPIDPGVYNDVVVHPMAPFRGPNIDPATVDVANIAAVLDPLSAQDLLEVRQRCSVVAANTTGRYTPQTLAFCEAVFAWVAANRPDAPVTDAALAAAAP